MDNQKFAPSYPRELDLRYPKVGSINPTVALSLLFMDTAEVLSVPIDAFEPQDLVLGVSRPSQTPPCPGPGSADPERCRRWPG